MGWNTSLILRDFKTKDLYVFEENKEIYFYMCKSGQTKMTSAY